MYKRVIIDIKKFDIEEIAYRYSLGKILFCEYSWSTRKYQEKTEETIKTLVKGIPFPVVYASELQTGELLILNKSGRLRMLLEELRDGNIKEQMDIDRYSLSNIFYSPITMYVIDYTNPKYMHMQVGNFAEEWSPTYEQAIRNVLYKEDGIRELDIIVENWKYRSYSRMSRLALQYNVIYFIMADFLKNGRLFNDEYRDLDRYQLLEETIAQINCLGTYRLEKLYDIFKEYFVYVDKYAVDKYRRSYPTEMKMKYLCFMYLCDEAQNPTRNYEWVHQIPIRRLLEHCDMSYNSIMKTMHRLKSGDF